MALKSTFLNDRMASNFNLDMSKNSPVLTASNVVSHCGMLAGVQSSFDVNKRKVLRNSFLLAYVGKDFTLVTNV